MGKDLRRGEISKKALASGQVSWDTNIKNIFIAEAMKVYKSCTGSCWALKGVASLVSKFKQQSAPDRFTNIADFFLKDGNGRSLLFRHGSNSIPIRHEKRPNQWGLPLLRGLSIIKNKLE